MDEGISYFPELENRIPVNTNKWGILNVCLSKCDNVISGHQWKYTYFDGFKTRVISSYDLTKLRMKVLHKGLSWVITDKKYAIDAYKLNNQLVDKHNNLKKNTKRVNSSSGVKYVYRRPDKGSRNGFYWVYVNKHSIGQKSYSSNSLTRLQERVERDGLPWEVVNKKLYSSLIERELL